MPYADLEKRRERQRQYTRRWRLANAERHREYQRRWKQAHPEYASQWDKVNWEKRLEYSRRTRERLRTEVLSLLGGKCARCGIDDPIVLQVDHINGGGTAEQRSLGVQGVYRKVLKDPSPYQLLCANCNWRKRFENDELPKCRKTGES